MVVGCEPEALSSAWFLGEADQPAGVVALSAADAIDDGGVTLLDDSVVSRAVRRLGAI